MQKVKYYITRYTKKGSIRYSGIGQIDNENLYTSYKNKYGEKIEHTYEDCIRYLHKIPDTENDYKGSFYEYQEIEFENDRNQIISREIEVDYKIWIRILD